MESKQPRISELSEIIERHPEYSVVFDESELFHQPLEGELFRGTHFPVRIWGGGQLLLPLRRLRLNPAKPELDIGIALLMTSEVTHSVLNLLTSRLVARIREFEEKNRVRIEGVAGIAKLGYSLAQRVSELFGHPNWIPIDSGRKLWYEHWLSSSAKSITTAESIKTMYVDPHIIGRIYGRNIAIVDDALNTGESALAGINVLTGAGAKNIFAFPIFTEGDLWKKKLTEGGFNWEEKVVTLGHLPIFTPGANLDEWTIIPKTS